jgi:hypothetical protein
MFESKHKYIPSLPLTCRGVVPQERRRNSPTSKLVTSLFIIHFSFFNLQSCGLDIEDPTPPSPPVWVQKSLPEEWPERGIDAHESDGIFLEWESNLVENVVAFSIYRAIRYEGIDSVSDFELVKRIQATSEIERQFVDRKVALTRVPYIYKVRAENESGNLSEFSDSKSYRLLPLIYSDTMIPNGVNDTLQADRTLSWLCSYYIELEDYCLTLLTEREELVCRAIIAPGSYVGGRESWAIPPEVELEPGKVYQWRIDAGARYIEGYETAGSESPWATFIYGAN